MVALTPLLNEAIAARRFGHSPAFRPRAPLAARTPVFDAPLYEIEESVADRIPSPRKRGSVVGFIVDPFRRRTIRFESGLEAKWLAVLIASPAVASVREQQNVRRVCGQHAPNWICDAMITWVDGSRSACEFKYEEDALKQGTRERLREIAKAVPQFADDFRLLTEARLDEATIANANLVISCAGDFDRTAQNLVRDIVTSHRRARIKLSTIVKAVGLGERGRRAAIALVQSGLLTPVGGRRIGEDCLFDITRSAP
jgi:hypothetical protein